MGVCESAEQVCEAPHKGGLILPLFGQDEQRWPNGLRVVLYLLGLGWCFLGVAIIADVFMSAIERITAKKIRIPKKDKPEEFQTYVVWNPTVANLTLMALGSSAPEILLSCIELFTGGFRSGELGPSTIVGSAAFNLLCITAVCVAAIPEGECRRVKEFPVYFVTASCSIFAYVWLLIILMVFTPDGVTPVEGLITFLFFPLLVFVAFLADKGYFSPPPEVEKSKQAALAADMSQEELAQCAMQVKKRYGEMTDDQVMRIVAVEFGPKPTRAQYRIAASRSITGGKRIAVSPGDTKMNPEASQSPMPVVQEEKSEHVTLGFSLPRYAVLENVGTVVLPVKRTGGALGLDHEMTIKYKTQDGTAHSDEDYKPVEGTLVFKSGEDTQDVKVDVIDDKSHEDDEEFFVKLTECTLDGKPYEPDEKSIQKATVVIIDDDEPGLLKFEKEQVEVTEGTTDVIVSIIVQRVNGCTGVVGCTYTTEDATAIAPNDYDKSEGQLELKHGQMSAVIKIKVAAKGRYESEENFRVIIKDATNRAKFDPKTDGGEDCCICTVVIKADGEAHDQVERLMGNLKINMDKMSLGHANWAAQMSAAIHVNGGEEGADPPTAKDYAMHFITVPWKCLFAIVPPVDYCDGWVCFFVALLMIGGVTAIIGDMASLLGCTMGISSPITAITLVALGTSLPDTFASKSAATMDPDADASIGNVTGSNSVNVFLGLGMPWAFGAFYWNGSADDEWRRDYASVIEKYPDYRDGMFIVEAGGLGFSVLVFSSCAVVCVALLYFRRLYAGGELGGKWRIPSAAFLVFLWVVYIGASIGYTLATLDCGE